MEIWKDIPNFEGIYQVSNLGRVKSLSRKITCNTGFRISNELILKPSIDKYGYEKIVLKKDLKPHYKTTHVLVAIAFLNHKTQGNTKIVVDHKDNNKLNNNVLNLQIITGRLNSSKDKKGTSVYTGVNFDKKSNKWKSQITFNYKKFHLGFFTNEIDAHNAYQKSLKTYNETNNIHQ